MNENHAPIAVYLDQLKQTFLRQNFNQANYHPRNVSHSTSDPLFQLREQTYRYAVIHLAGLKLICDNTPSIPPGFFFYLLPTLEASLQRLGAVPPRQKVQIQSLFKDFHTECVSVLHYQNVPNAEQALKTATNCVLWPINNWSVTTATHDSLQHDRHLLPLPGDPRSLLQAEVPGNRLRSRYADLPAQSWWPDTAPWLQNFLTQAQCADPNHKAYFSLPSGLTALPGMRQYAKHTYHAYFEGTEQTQNLHSCLRIGDLIPWQLNAPDDVKLQLGADTLCDLIDEAIRRHPAFDSGIGVKIPILVQTPSRYDAAKNTLIHRVIEQVRHDYADRQSAIRDKHGLDVIVLNAPHQFAQRRHEQTAMINIKSGKHLRNTFADLIDQYLKKHFNYPHFKDFLNTNNPIWDAAKTQAIVRALSFQSMDQPVKTVTLLQAFGAMNNSLQRPPKHQLEHETIFYLMSCQAILIATLDGVRILHEADPQLSALSIIHTDGLLHCLTDQWVESFKKVYTSAMPIPPFPPLKAHGDETVQQSYRTFRKNFLDNIENKHQTHWLENTRPSHHNTVPMASLSGEHIKQLWFRQQRRHVAAIYAARLQLTSESDFNDAFKPAPCQDYDHCIAHLIQRIEAVIDASAQNRSPQKPYIFTPRASRSTQSITETPQKQSPTAFTDVFLTPRPSWNHSEMQRRIEEADAAEKSRRQFNESRLSFFLNQLRRRMDLETSYPENNRYYLSREGQRAWLELLNTTPDSYPTYLQKVRQLAKQHRPSVEACAKSHIRALNDFLIEQSNVDDPKPDAFHAWLVQWTEKLPKFGFPTTVVKQVQSELHLDQRPASYGQKPTSNPLFTQSIRWVSFLTFHAWWALGRLFFQQLVRRIQDFLVRRRILKTCYRFEHTPRTSFDVHEKANADFDNEIQRVLMSASQEENDRKPTDDIVRLHIAR